MTEPEQTNLAADRLRQYITVHGNGKANRDAMHGMLDEALATARQQGREEAVQRVRLMIEHPVSGPGFVPFPQLRKWLDAIARDGTNVLGATRGEDRP